MWPQICFIINTFIIMSDSYVNFDPCKINFVLSPTGSLFKCWLKILYLVEEGNNMFLV